MYFVCRNKRIYTSKPADEGLSVGWLGRGGWHGHSPHYIAKHSGGRHFIPILLETSKQQVGGRVYRVKRLWLTNNNAMITAERHMTRWKSCPGFAVALIVAAFRVADVVRTLDGFGDFLGLVVRRGHIIKWTA